MRECRKKQKRWRGMEIVVKDKSKLRKGIKKSKGGRCITEGEKMLGKSNCKCNKVIKV